MTTERVFTIWAQDTYVIEIEADSLTEALDYAYELDDDEWTYVATSVEAEEFLEEEEEEEKE